MKKSVLVFIIFALCTGCSSRVNIKQDPFYKTFFEKTRLIMTAGEIKIYRRLPDKESREEFIEEFWRIRDYDPTTDENEGKIEFERRIDYANRWFGAWNKDRGKEMYRDRDEYLGWDTDRGRMYIILGPPDMIYYGGSGTTWEGERNRSSDSMYALETWYYYRYELYVQFHKTFMGRWRLALSASNLSSAFKSAKLDFVSPADRVDSKSRFKFKAKYEDHEIIIIIPVTRVSFKEEGGTLNSKFRIKITIRHNDKKIDEIEETQSFSESEDELMKKNDILLIIPYTLPQKGKYIFDIIVEDLMSLSYSKYRNFVTFTNKE
jgi:GWxTD domain-containing protein